MAVVEAGERVWEGGARKPLFLAHKEKSEVGVAEGEEAVGEKGVDRGGNPGK